MKETQVPSLGGEDPLEKEMATHSSILTWRIPWTDEPGRGLKRVGHDLVTEHDHKPAKSVDSSWPMRSCWPVYLLCPHYLCSLFLINSLPSAMLCVWTFFSNPRLESHNMAVMTVQWERICCRQFSNETKISSHPVWTTSLEIRKETVVWQSNYEITIQWIRAEIDSEERAQVSRLEEDFVEVVNS